MEQSVQFIKSKKQLIKTMKLHGYSVTAEAATFLTSQLTPFSEVERGKWINNVLKKIETMNISDVAIQKDHLVACLKECTKSQPSTETIFNVISAYDLPIFKFDPEKNKFLKDTGETKHDIFSAPATKSEIYRRRYHIILQRIQRHQIFRKKTMGNGGPVYELKTAEWFKCVAGKIDKAVMLGLLVQRGPGMFELEDPTGSISLDLSQCKFRDGLFTEHCFVLAEGVFDDKIFHAIGLGNPPPELAKISRPYFGNLNTFGGPSEKSLVQSSSLFKIENENPDGLIVFVSDVSLDNLMVLSQLKNFFAGFAVCPPVAFVLLGNFLSQQPDAKYASRLKEAFRELGDIITSVPEICQHSRFVLVPGPNDPGSPLIFPRPALPEHIIGDLKRRVPLLTAATNPCRIQYCTKEMVVVREDLLTKMCRNALHFPSEGDIPTHFAKTLIANACIAPLSLYTWPVYWSHSCALDLYPLPDLLIVGDHFSPFSVSHYECQVVNPGSFARNGFSFQAYTPAKNSIQELSVPEGDT